MTNNGHPARVVVVLTLAAAALLLTTCRQPDTPAVEERPAVVVENPELRLRLNGVPDDFEVVANDGAELALAPADPAIEGRIIVAALDPAAGQNLPAEVEAHQSFVAGQEGGDPRGGQELLSPLGTTFYSRGRYLVDGAEIEETAIFAIHPDGDRIVTITYRYPADGDSTVRVQQLFDVLAVVEGLD
jgi:hypothetical protein